MRRTLYRMVALVATTLVGCSLFIDTSGFVSDDAVDAQAESGIEASTVDAQSDGGPVDGAIGDSPAPADVLVDGPVDASVCSTPPNDPSLKGWYLFDEGSGTNVIDCSMSGRHGVQVAGTWTTGKKGGGLAFNGTTSCVTLPAGLSLLTGFTIAAWVNVTSFADSTGDSRYIVGKSDAMQDKGWSLKVDAPPHYELTLGSGAARVDLNSPANQASNVWTHVVGVYQPSMRSEIWINGALAITGTPPASIADEPAAPPRIGCRNGVHMFSGIIDEVRIYDRALPSAEIPPLAQ